MNGRAIQASYRRILKAIRSQPRYRGFCAAAVVVLALGVVAFMPAQSFDFVPSAVPQQALAQEASVDEGEIAAQEVICVYVCGQVENAGVYEVPAGARLAEVLQLAGGFTEEADDQALNLARIVSDGEQIIVPQKGVHTEEGQMAFQSAQSLVSINAASAEQLQALPGIGPSYAQRIVDYRATHGSFTSIEQLKNVSGIGDKRFEELKDLITL